MERTQLPVRQDALIPVVEEGGIVAYDDNRGPCCVKFPELVDDVLPGVGIEAGGRLIGEHELGVDDDGPGQGRALDALMNGAPLGRALHQSGPDFDFEQLLTLMLERNAITALTTEEFA